MKELVKFEKLLAESESKNALTRLKAKLLIILR